MFCPRCGRPVSDTANFCGGCGLPRAEIERYLREQHKEKADSAVSETIDSKTEDVPADSGFSDSRPEDNKTYRAEDTRQEFSGADTAQNTVYNDSTAYSYERPDYGRSSWQYADNTGRCDDGEALSTVDYLWMMLISCIPLVGLVYLLYLAFGSGVNTNKRSYARASLILMIFASVIGMVFFIGLVASVSMMI